MPNNLILTGFSGTGKSQVGLIIAQLWGWDFFDTDDEVTLAAGKSIADIFEQDGEAHFRHLERQAVASACNSSRAVVSTGGGSIVDPDNYRTMITSGVIICLEATPETITRRLQESSDQVSDLRPLLTGPDMIQRIRGLKTQRQAYYGLAKHTVHTDKLTLEEVAQEVYARWQEIAHGATNEGASEKLSPAFVVEAPSASYPVFVDWGLQDHIGKFLLGIGIRGPVYVITDSNVFGLHHGQVQRALEATGIEAHTFTVPAGEASKSLAMAESIFGWLAERRCERSHAIIALGGGMIGDLTGFVAATFLRGVPVIQVPTSLAAMVDASIGGKTAVNLSVGKNLVGAFYQPSMVLADLDTLKTLPARELASGWAEAIKHGLILDASLFRLIEERVESLLKLEPEITVEVIRRSMAIKAKVVEEDEKETTGKRILLNYGHTIGHGLEAATHYTELLHGEAVSVGIVGAGEMSQKMGLLSREELERHTKMLQRFGLPISYPGVNPHSVLKAMELDKKAASKVINWVLLQETGRATVRSDVDEELVQQTLNDLCR
ncbi:3-dehydroquinate synthase [SAR202 cluster bacterium AC-647-N09_OGT_505m]|nr:3-dehydroquinate synthase [SAR202 cluster bacterium AC-647-N09_OGT_505m]